MKINKSKSPFVSGSEIPDEKDIARTIKNANFADTLAAIETTEATDSASNATRTTLTQIAVQYDLSNEENCQSAVQESAEFLVKSRLGEKYRDSEKIVKDLGRFVADDPFLKNKLISVLLKLSNAEV